MTNDTRCENCSTPTRYTYRTVRTSTNTGRCLKVYATGMCEPCAEAYRQALAGHRALAREAGIYAVQMERPERVPLQPATITTSGEANLQSGLDGLVHVGTGQYVGGYGWRHMACGQYVYGASLGLYNRAEAHYVEDPELHDGWEGTLCLSCLALWDRWLLQKMQQHGISRSLVATHDSHPIYGSTWRVCGEPAVLNGYEVWERIGQMLAELEGANA